MSIIAAQKFLRDSTTDKHLRTSLEEASSREQLQEILNSTSYDFTNKELDDGYRNLLVNCQTEGQAQIVKDIRQWWDFLVYCTPETKL